MDSVAEEKQILEGETDNGLEEGVPFSQQTTIEEWINQVFINLTNEDKIKLKETLASKNIHFKQDLMSLQGSDDIIGDICEQSSLSAKITAKVTSEIGKINNNNAIPTLILSEQESVQYSKLQERTLHWETTMQKVKEIISNKNKNSEKLDKIIDELKKKNDLYYDKIEKYLILCENNVSLLNKVKNEIISKYQKNQDFQIICEVSACLKLIQNNSPNQPFNIVDDILFILEHQNNFESYIPYQTLFNQQNGKSLNQNDEIKMENENKMNSKFQNGNLIPNGSKTNHQNEIESMKEQKETKSKSEIVNDNIMQQIIKEWLPNHKIQLLYRASKDGFDSKSFHNKCDHKGKTITIIKNDKGYIFGGFTSVQWTSENGYKPDENAFLFQLHPQLKKYPLQNNRKQYGVFHNSGYGPTFGGGFDIYVCSNCNKSKHSYCTPFSYSLETALSFTGYDTHPVHFFIVDYEVFELL